MKRFFLFFILLGCFFQLEAQERTANDTILMLENKIWRAEFPSEKSYTQEMEFREGGWWTTFTYNKEKVMMEDSYRISGDTIKTYGCKQYLIWELTDSTLIIHYLPKELVIGNGLVKYVNTINSPAKMLENEQRLDSIWRKENIWNKGVADISGKPTFRNDAAAKSANRLTAHTTEPHLEVGVPVCYLNERGDTIVPYGKYRYCQTDTITGIGFVYENKQKKSRIVCINDAGKELFYVFKCDNGPDYLKEGLFRMMDEQGRIGFADSLGNVVIHPQFLYATPFANGHAYVTEHGEESKDREHTTWQSDEWKIINRNGNELLEYTVIRKDKAIKGLLIRYSHPSGSMRTLTYTYPEDIALADNFHAEVMLKDLNFDGQDDIAIPLGNYGNQRIQYEDGYLWDKTQKTYVPVKQLKEIANPRIDKEERCLFSFSRESAASYHYERFEYVNAELVKTAELIQTYRQAGGKPLFTEKHYQKGKGMRVVHSSVPIREISHYWLKIVQ